MAAPTLTDCPANLIAGDSLTLEQSFSDYQAPTWTLSFYLYCRDAERDLITWTFADGGGGKHLLTLGSSTTGTYIPGEYYVIGFVTSSDDQRQKVYDGFITIKPNWAAAQTGNEVRTYNERVLGNLKDAMETLSSATADTVSVEGTSYSRRNISALQSMIDIYQARVDAERVETSQQEGRYTRRITVRFTRPT